MVDLVGSPLGDVGQEKLRYSDFDDPGDAAGHDDSHEKTR